MDQRVEKVSLAFQDFRDRLEIEAPPDPLESLGLMAHQDQKVISGRKIQLFIKSFVMYCIFPTYAGYAFCTNKWKVVYLKLQN